MRALLGRGARILGIKGRGLVNQSPQGGLTGGMDAHAVYFQPRVADLHDQESLELPSGVLRMVAEPGRQWSWTSEQRCNPANARNFLDAPEAGGLRTAVGFSLGRVALAYLLKTNSAEQLRQLVAVDPGNVEDFTDSCDSSDTSHLIADWLGNNSTRRFRIYAGKRTAEDGHAGIKGLYLSAISGTAVAAQVEICDTGQGHESTWNRVKAGVFNADLAAGELYVPPGGRLWRPADA